MYDTVKRFLFGLLAVAGLGGGSVLLYWLGDFQTQQSGNWAMYGLIAAVVACYLLVAWGLFRLLPIIDQYILRAFILNYLLLLAALTILVNTLDLILNQDEFVKAGRAHADKFGGSVFLASCYAVWDYYWPQIFFYFIYMSGLLSAAAVGFTLAQFQRNRELVAMVAGGISLHRVALPMLFAGCLCSSLLVIDQELIVAHPDIQRKLSRSHSDMVYGVLRSFPVEFVPDSKGTLFCAREFDNRVDVMHNVTILLRDTNGINTERIQATEATWNPRKQRWEFLDGYRILESGPAGTNIQRRHEIAYLESDLDPTTLRLQKFSKYRQLLGIPQLRELMNKSLLINVPELRRMLHSRFSFPAMNLLILAMALPLFLQRTPGNLMQQTIKAVPLCLGAWGGGFIMLQIGPDQVHPILVAWMPVITYLPVAFYLMDRLET